jgi:riboflavin biosynthesis pyrimidine reductase
VAAGRVGPPSAVAKRRGVAWRGLLLDVKRNVELAAMLANLTARGIGRLFAEGGTMIHTHLTSRSDLVQYLKSR